jgi:hypothetical protein
VNADRGVEVLALPAGAKVTGRRPARGRTAVERAANQLAEVPG